MKLKSWPTETVVLDREDIDLIAKKSHPWQIDMAKKYGSISKDDWFSLPPPYMLAFNSAFLSYKKGDGKYGKGYAEAAWEISQEDPWFLCHFLGDPVMPGSQGLDAFMQLGGLWAAGTCEVTGGRGRALAGSFTYNGQVLPISKKIYYRLDVVRFLKKKKIVLFEGHLAVDDPDHIIYRFEGHKLGFFTAKELGTPPGGPSTYYHPDWKRTKEEVAGYVQNAIDFYEKEKK